MAVQTENNDILIRFENLTKYYGSFLSVSNLNMEIKKGEVIGFLGPNGAGKTTTMKMMARILKPSSGAILYNKNGEFHELNARSKDYLLQNVGFLVENPSFYNNVTPRQLLTLIARVKGYPRDKIPKRVEEVVQMVKMSEWIDKKLGTFSKGMKEKIGIICALVHDPEIIILDEPQTGLDPKARVDVRNFILELKKMGKTIFFSSHLLYEVSEVADKIAIIANGHLIAFDTMQSLESHAKSSLIRIQILNSDNGNIMTLLDKLVEILYPQVEKGIIINKITYSPESREFNINFDGDPAHQRDILQSLTEHKIDVVDFSVSKAGALEDLYMNLVTDSDQKTVQFNSNN